MLKFATVSDWWS